MSVPSNNQHYLVGVVSWGKGCAAVRISDYYKDRRVERQSRWPEALLSVWQHSPIPILSH